LILLLLKLRLADVGHYDVVGSITFLDLLAHAWLQRLVISFPLLGLTTLDPAKERIF